MAGDMIDKLREEIIESEKSRIDLLKWKFILIAALGSIGLGIEDNTTIFSRYITLCLIPPVCVYVDLLCKHLNLRILCIAYFIRYTKINKPPESSLSLAQEYEQFCCDVRKPKEKNKNEETNNSKPLCLEDLAQEWSTLIIIGLLIGLWTKKILLA